MATRTTQGRAVHPNSTLCASRSRRWAGLVVGTKARYHRTPAAILTTKTITQSWKKFNCSMRGEAPFCRLSFILYIQKVVCGTPLLHQNIIP